MADGDTSTKVVSPDVPQPPAPGPAWFWLKDNSGKSSATLTFATVSFFVTTAAYALSTVQTVGGVSLRPFDPSSCAAYLGTTFALYFGRRFTDAKFGA